MIRTKKGIVITLAVFSAQFANAQECSCADNYVWLKETFEKNDAGFQYVIDQKGEAAYQGHSDAYATKVKAITDDQQCVEALSSWLRFFRNGHLGIGLNGGGSSSGSTGLDTAKVRALYSDWETYAYDEQEFSSYLSELKEPTLEGIWSSPPYTFGIRKVKDEYLGFVLEADGVYWSKTQLKFKIREEKGVFSATYYMKDHSAREFPKVEMLGNNYLQMDFVTLNRVAPVFPSDERIERHSRLLSTEVPLFEKVGERTALLRIPSFSHSEKQLIDSVINANWQTIISTENLIIDLRYNGGGSDVSYEGILPIIYTDPIRTVGVELLSSKLNNQRMVDFMNDPNWSEEDKEWAKESLDKLEQRMGEFVNLDSTDVTVQTFDTIHAYPKNVGIIIHEGNGSTTEQFLLAAKQSKKVKLFGTTTAGVLDISNMYFVNSPCEDFTLGYSLSRSMRIPEMTIDDKGIQPDHYIDKTISSYGWVEFVNEILISGS